MAVAFGRYELLKKIASGGMGQVFLARTATAGFQKLVVIKRILPHLVEDEEFLTMFFDEAGIAARLNHPNLVQIFDLGEANGMHYLAMEYVAGDDVRRVEKTSRKQNRPIPVGVACRIIADAAAGLDYAHKVKDATGNPLNLVHRDVSPQNILVSFDGGVKLIDFGVARAVGRAQHTATGILKGKYPYMSPEQITGDAYDHRSDQFALAIVFWEILTGRRLFKGDSDLVTMRLVRECNVPAPSQLNPALPKELDALVLKALSLKPQDRFPDTGAFRMALENFIVAQGMPASSAHLAAFMRELYQERIEREADLSNLDELSGPSAFDEESSPSESRASRAAANTAQPLAPSSEVKTISERHLAAARAPAAEPSRFTQPLTNPRGKSKTALGVGFAAAVLLVSVAVAIPLLRGGQDAPPAPAPAPVVIQVDEPRAPPEQTAEAQPAAQDPTPEAPEPVRIQLRSKPAGAEVTVNGEKLGRTPVEFALSPGAEGAKATFTLAGYEPHVTTLTADAAPAVDVQLKRRKVSRPPPKDGPPLGIKTGR